jgi:hypothetical protein
METDNTQVPIAGDFTINIWAKDLGTEIVSAFEATLDFNDDLFLLQDIRFGEALGNGIDSFQSFFPSEDSLLISEISLISDADLSLIQAGDEILLASIDMTRISQITSSLTLNNLLVIGNNARLLDLDAVSPITISNPVQSVSSPSMFSLTFLGLLLFMVGSKHMDVDFKELRQ